MSAICFLCNQPYESQNNDDLAGDGKCTPCKEKSKQIAFRVDIEMAKKRAANPTPTSRIRQLFSEEEILKGDTIQLQKRLNIRDLGINPSN